MKEELLKKIDDIAKDLMDEDTFEYYQRYDREGLAQSSDSAFPLILQFGKYHCYTIVPNVFADLFLVSETVRYDVAREGIFTLYNLNFGYENDNFFLVTENDIQPISIPQAKEVIRDIMTPVLMKWIKENGNLPTKFKVEVKFPNISLSELKEILYKDAKEGGTLLRCFKRFHSYVQRSKVHYVSIWWDKKHNEFSFGVYQNDICTLNGGIIYHGNPETGYLQNGSVQIEPSYGWQIHT